MHSTLDTADEILANLETEEPLSPTYSTLPTLLSLYHRLLYEYRLNFSERAPPAYRLSNAAFDFPLKALFPAVTR
jgi:hypothetical protein